MKWKFDFPIFNGEDPHGWIHRCEEFFLFHATPEHQNVCATAFNVEGDASKWLRYQRVEAPTYSWAEL